MSSAFRNFFITFAVCLLIFGFFGLKYVGPMLNDLVDFTDMGDTSGEESTEVSNDTSEETSQATPVVDNDFDEDGDVFTAVVMCVDSNNRAINTAFIDANGKTKQYIYCTVPTNVKGINNVGVTVPVGDLFSTMTLEAICDKMTSMTGIETQYCLRFDRDGVREMAKLVPGASITLNEEIIFINPEYEDYVPEEGEDYPDDYYITISNVDGKVLLNEKLNGKTKLDWLMEYNPNANGEEYNALYSLIAKSVLNQFLKNGSLMSTSTMSTVIKNCETNLTTDDATEHLATIFSRDDFKYTEMIYPASWESAVSKLRDLDGSFNR